MVFKLAISLTVIPATIDWGIFDGTQVKLTLPTPRFTAPLRPGNNMVELN
jgi:hypothetical protein